MDKQKYKEAIAYGEEKGFDYANQKTAEFAPKLFNCLFFQKRMEEHLGNSLASTCENPFDTDLYTNNKYRNLLWDSYNSMINQTCYENGFSCTIVNSNGKRLNSFPISSNPEAKNTPYNIEIHSGSMLEKLFFKSHRFYYKLKDLYDLYYLHRNKKL